MWGNWSDTNRGSRLTPSYANSAPMASDGSLNTVRQHRLPSHRHRHGRSKEHDDTFAITFFLQAKNAVLTAFHTLALKVGANAQHLS